MNNLQTFICEKKDKKPTAAEIRKAGEAALKDEQEKNKKEQKKKGKSEYTKYLEKQLEYKKQKYEDQKKQQLENIKKKKSEKHVEKAKQALRNIKTDVITDKDKDPTAYAKAVGNVASFVGGVTKASIHGARALAARKKKEKEAEQAKSKQQEKKEPGRPGRRRSAETRTDRTPESKKPEPKQIAGKPESKKLVPSTKRLPPATKKIAPSGGTPYQAEPNPTKETGMRLGQRARRNPKLKAELIKSRMEEYSDWRTELLNEYNLIIEVDNKNEKKTKKNNIIDVMKGKNTIEINPKLSEEKTAAWQRKEGKNPEGGLNAKGRASAKAQGHNLKPPVTTPPSELDPDSMAAKRRKSFCARMGGMPGPMKDEQGRPTRKALSLKKWNC